MQKKFLALFLSLCLLAAMTTGCGGNSAPQASRSDDTATIGGDQSSQGGQSSEETPSSQETSEPPAEEPEPEPEPVKTWFEEQGLTITPQGDFTYLTGAININGEKVGAYEVKANAVITETTDGVEPGYKKVSIVCTNDIGGYVNVPNAIGYYIWRTAFDRYTGIAFEFDSSTSYTDFGETSQKEGFITIVNGDESYDVSIAFEWTNNNPIMIGTTTVTCPVDYDGVVFQVGYSDAKLVDENSQIDYRARLYTLDELPFYGDNYYYFSYTNE